MQVGQLSSGTFLQQSLQDPGRLHLVALPSAVPPPCRSESAENSPLFLTALDQRDTVPDGGQGMWGNVAGEQYLFCHKGAPSLDWGARLFVFPQAAKKVFGRDALRP